MPAKFMFLLAGDIGGTNSRLALHTPPPPEDEYDTDDYDTRCETHKTPLFVQTYKNGSYVANHGSEAFDVILNKFLTEFLDDCDKKPSGLTEKNFVRGDVVIIACFACAGPINKNVCRFTNIQPVEKKGYSAVESWPGREDIANKFVIDGNEIQACDFGLIKSIVQCRVVNDFVGQGYGALDLDLKTEVVQLVPDSDKLINELGPKVCVGAGTGLGECYLTIPTRSPDVGYECYPSEGGHVEFAPRSDLQVEMLTYLKAKFGSKHRVSVERVVSGKGLANVYEFLAQKFPDKVDKKMHEEFLAAGDMQGKVVNVHAKEGNLCHDALLIMSSAYGSEVGSAALKYIPTGGMYVTGGVTPKIIEHIRKPDSPFMKAYRDKGRVSPILNTVPLFAVMSEDLGLRGARVSAVNEMKSWMTKQWVSAGRVRGSVVMSGLTDVKETSILEGGRTTLKEEEDFSSTERKGGGWKLQTAAAALTISAVVALAGSVVLKMKK